ncbi:DinB family protein [Halobacillus sp. A1]|uniref:DinB family protein n=1 Tax=Halobacillus sp. A1 TaxID=2880262 RepID=UPI0020A6440A|nr:DinB family protein [Halobacillus sp. A1]MCP3030918.1 DinB family protein [Halobacillus sp. A1]
MQNRHDNLFEQLEQYRRELLSLVDDVTEKESNSIPKGFNNNIRWNLGHVYLDQFSWLQFLTKEKSPVPENFQKWFGFGTNPNDFDEHTPSLEELKQLLSVQPQQIKKMYGDRLEVEYSTTEMNMRTIEQVLIRTIFHEGMHFQAILDIKKFL